MIQKDKRQLSLRLNDRPMETWKVGKSRETIAFIVEAEQYLQGPFVSGAQRKALISATTMIKQGAWKLIRRRTPQYVAEHLADMIASGEIRT